MNPITIEIHAKLIAGIRRFFVDKPHRATLGLSGGLDSALVLSLAVEALGPKADIRVLLLPSPYSTPHSVDDAVQLVCNLNVVHDIIPIGPLYDQFNLSLAPLFSSTKQDVTEENLQARIRATLLMALSNKFGHFLLNTSNKSELAMGYGTLYGDLCGALSVLGDVYKTQAYDLAAYINRDKEIIPVNTILKEPSAELRHDQKDSDSLPKYELLDQILTLFIEEEKEVDYVIAKGFDPEVVARVRLSIDKSSFKAYQIPPIIQVTNHPVVPLWKCI